SWCKHPGTADGLAPPAEAARVTSRIKLGVGVIPLTQRAPESIVAGVRQQYLPLDRLLLGIGSPNPGALARVRAGVAALRDELTTQIYVAALGPRMSSLAGEIADRGLLNRLT